MCRCLWMQVDTMEKIAQGRVWTGKDAASRDLLAAITGFSRVVATARHKAKIHQNRKWTEKDATRMLSSRRGTKVMVLARISNTSEPPTTLRILGMIVIETLKYLISERGIMVKALDAIISDASPRYDCLEIAYLRDLRPYKIVILRLFLPEINLPLYVSNIEKVVEVAAMTETETISYTTEHVVGQGSFGITDKNELYLNLVLEYVPETPYRVTRHCSKKHEGEGLGGGEV
ncbi:hypothetical protein Tco_0926469 [Tanacetum coccineum]|uniref:Uncharacterized protein n=1 Tax=Tanacetum coccineum TaxID=301880 RepID=A0ABQ5D9W3_9ASTR